MPRRTNAQPEEEVGVQPSSLAASVRMRAVKQRDNEREVALRSALHRLGLRFRIHAKIAPTIRARPDVVFAGARVAVFVDGCFWHRCPTHGTLPKANAAWWLAKLNANVARDEATNAALRALGWRVLRIWEHEEPARAAMMIARVVRERLRRRVARADRTSASGPAGNR
jgi:DNA mismatch endonuclease (patch repair protein)